MNKRWAEITPKEIEKNIQKQCRVCKYRSRDKIGGHIYCDYFGVTGKLRNCSPINCEKFKEDVRAKRKTRPILAR